jgi:hypothetical protein
LSGRTDFSEAVRRLFGQDFDTAHLFDVEPHPYPVKNFEIGDPFIDEVKRAGIEIKI